jgi:adenylate cyclase
MLAEFASVVDAVRCAVEVQQGMPDRNTGLGSVNCVELRIGINLGDVIVEDDDLYGDGVNIAARIEALADAGDALVSNTVHDHVRDRLPFVFEDLSEQRFKNKLLLRLEPILANELVDPGELVLVVGDDDITE